MKRIFDLFFCIILIPIIFIPYFFICLIILIQNDGPILHWSKRIGRNNIIFLMPKFRTMKLNTPQLATHLLKNPNSHITFSGSFLRKTSLDELPQLYSVLIGRMSIVGPRPALYNQYDLIEIRRKKDIDQLKPGITGLAQINGRDELSIDQKVLFDYEYLLRNSIFFDIKIIIHTLLRVFTNKNITH
tara:strand:- start:27 stop:587 length:561 start_codon:yes stop_codon:yes gene_type:complete